MDDLEFSEFSEYPCRICGSIEYRYYGGGYNCREGHRNDELREQVADEDDFDFSRSQMRNTQLSMSKMTPQTARVASKKFRKRSGKGDHDVNDRYGITEEQQAQLFEEERSRFQRKGDKKKHVIMEAAMQILILQIEAMKKSFPNLWKNQNQKEEFEKLARNLFQSYANELSFPYSHTDTKYPELPQIAPVYQPSKYFRRKQQQQQKLGTDEAIEKLMNEPSFDDLDRELLLDDYDYGNESSLSDSEDDKSGLEILSKAIPDTVDTVMMQDKPKATRFPGKRSKPLNNPFSYMNMTFLTHLALIHTGIPVLFSDLARGLELGTIPGYRPDFHLTKDIVTVRFNINELRAFHTRFIPGTDQLYRDSRLMLEMLARQCKVPDWKLDSETRDALLLRLIDEMALPREYFPFIKRQVIKCIGPLNFLILNPEGIYLTPCALLSAAILFFLRLLYTLTSFDEEDNPDIFAINCRLEAQQLPTQSDLLEKWTKILESKTLFAQKGQENEPVTNDEDFAELLEMANRMLAPTCIIDNKASIKGLFGIEKYEAALKTKSNKEDLRSKSISGFNGPIREIELPRDNFKRYQPYPENFNLNALPLPHKMALRLIKTLVGVCPADLERIISRVFEKQDPTVLERNRVCTYKKKSGRKEKEKLETDLYLYY